MPVCCKDISELFKIDVPTDRFCLILISKGSGVLSLGERKFGFVGPKIYCFNEKENPIISYTSQLEGLVLLFHPSFVNDSFNFENIRNAALEFSGTVLNDEFYLEPFLHRDSKYYGQLNPGLDVFQRMNSLITNLDTQLKSQPDMFWPCRSRSYLLEVLFLIEKIRSNDLLDLTFEFKVNNNVIENVILYIQNNYYEKISILSLTNMFNINRTTLSEQFLNATGFTIMAYLTNLRIHIASLILRDSRIPISEVCDRAGFNDINHFGRVFKKYTGDSPNKYRQNYCTIV